jgi:hypothetical protein
MVAGIVPDGPPLSIKQWAVLGESWFPGLVDRSERQTTWPEITPHYERIKNWIGVVTIATIHRRLRDAHGLGPSESSLRRYIWANFEQEVAYSAVRVLYDSPGGLDLDCGPTIHPRARFAVRAQRTPEKGPKG